jgi:hypothetical protein
VGAAIAGIALIITAVVLWLGNLTVAHALAILIGLTGVLLVLYWGVPGAYGRRG